MPKHRSIAMSRLPDLAELRFQIRKFAGFSEATCEAAGLSAQHYQLLQVIAASSEGQGASISYLAERMILRHNSAVELVDRAVRAGLVKRTSDQDDLRRSLVLLTVPGAELLERLATVHLAELDAEGHHIVNAMQRLHASKVSATKETG